MTPAAYQASWNPDERTFRQCVIYAAQSLGGFVYFTHDSRHSPAGFPDLVIVLPDRQRVIFAELKTNRGRTTLDQDTWLDALGRCPGVETYLWRPAMWDEILAVLSGQRAGAVA